jgi:predicted GH43/DUF377 family glycosyl hydrolase
MRKQYFFLMFIVVNFFSCSEKAYLFTSFHEPANEGLRMLYSYDGYKWKDFDTTFLKPTIGKDKIMRDPSMLQAPDGIFHLVWTTEWRAGNGFGYASSKDLLHWSDQKYIPVMQHEPTVVNVWAPELFYNDISKQYIIIWASTIPFRYEKGIESDSNNHRMYYTNTNDFKTFTDAKLFLDPKFSIIDAVIVKQQQHEYALVLKDNTRPERNLKVAFAHSPWGTWENMSKPFTEKFTEGPTVVKVKNGYLIYYDAYQNKKYGASFTKDFKTFVNADSLISVPMNHKHGTIVEVKKSFLKKLIKNVLLNK